MQTFLPYSDFEQTAKCLDYRRLGKQRVEAAQILSCLRGVSSTRWKNHPAVKMWAGFENALEWYYNTIVREWISRGYKNNMTLYSLSSNIQKPEWLGNENFHAAHRSNLLRKNEEYYSQFGWTESTDLEYVWPKKD